MTKMGIAAVRVMWLVPLVFCEVSISSSAAVAEPALREMVVPIDWKRFDRPIQQSEDYRRCVRILLNSARYNIAWAPGSAERIEKGWRELTGRQAHDVIRPTCSVGTRTCLSRHRTGWTFAPTRCSNSNYDTPTVGATPRTNSDDSRGASRCSSRSWQMPSCCNGSTRSEQSERKTGSPGLDAGG